MPAGRRRIYYRPYGFMLQPNAAAGTAVCPEPRRCVCSITDPVPLFLYFADELRHGTHGAVDAPGARLEQQHGDDAQNSGREHDAVKAE